MATTTRQASVLDAARTLRKMLRAFDPAVLSGGDCAAVVAELTMTEKACETAAARAAARATECGAHRSAGFADAEDWLARHAGSTRGQARSTLETAAQLADCPATAEAAVAGQLSMAQAGEITQTEALAPGSEAELLDLARRTGLSGLRDRARKRRQDAIGADELHVRRHAARHLRNWVTEIGNIGIAGQLPPEIGVPFLNRLDAETDRIRRAAKQQATRNNRPLERREAYAADAFAKIIEGGGKGRHNHPDMVIVCDLNAWRRGHAYTGEPCHIIGAGPIPVRLAKELAQDAFLKAVLHDGTNIHTVAHHGRHFPAELATALNLGAPPHFEGIQCVSDHCDRRYHLEWDHDKPRANQGPTSYGNLVPRCWPCHQDKTRRDRAEGLLNNKDKPPPLLPP